jgi:hypothetical protein
MFQKAQNTSHCVATFTVASCARSRLTSHRLFERLRALIARRAASNSVDVPARQFFLLLMRRLAMDCVTRLAVVTVLSLGLFAGCNKGSAPEGAATATATIPVPVIVETDPATNPVAKAAYDFLDSVLKGDTQRSSSLLTPQAMQRIVQSGKQFALPGLEKATFKVGKVADLSPGHVAVQCVLTDASEGTPHSEEMCCLLRQTENGWRVFGIAYGTAPDKPWIFTNFESGQSIPVRDGAMNALAGGQGAGGQQNPGMSANAGGPPVTPQAAIGMPPIAAPTSTPNAAGSAGLGMPAIGPQTQNPYGQSPQQPYTAQEPGGSERR